jgi:iduronate 2-sulfatase
MKRIRLLALPLGLAALCHASVQGAGRPNVLMIVVDDLSPPAIQHPAFGDSHVSARTPSIDRLITGGVAFNRAYANWPSCAPARQAFMSGALPEKTGYRFYGNVREQAGRNRSVVYMGEHFKNNGYSTIRLDKIYHIGRDVAHQWDVTEEPFGVNRNEVTQQASEFAKLGFTTADRLRYAKFTEMGGEKSEIIEMKTTDTAGNPITADRLTDGITKLRALHYLDDLATPGGQFDAAQKPFFLAVGFRRPHLPFTAPASYYRKFKWGDGDTNFEPGTATIVPPPVNQTFNNQDEYRQALEGYYACLLMTDDHIGSLLDKLDSTGLAEDTIVVFYGDHGYGLGEHNKYFSKGTPDNVGFHTPLVFRVPGGRSGAVIDKAVTLVDVYPTLSDLCGLPRPETPLDGSSLVPLLEKNDPDWVENAIAFLGDNDDATLPVSRFVWAEGYKYYETDGSGPQELYAVGAGDPFEWSNLVNNNSFSAQRTRLKQRMDSLMQRSLDRTAPDLLQHPLSQAVPAGRSALFSIRPAGNKTYKLQWSKNGVPLAGQTGTSLVIPNVTAINAGIYACTVVNDVGRTFSYRAELRVLSSAGELFDWQIDDTHAPFLIDGVNGAPFETITLGSSKFNNTLQTSYYSDRNGFAYVRPGLPFGNYEVYTHVPNWRSTNPTGGSSSGVTHVVNHRTGSNSTVIDQRDGIRGWVLLGTHSMGPTSELVIHARTAEPGSRYPALDGARFKRVSATTNSVPLALNEPGQSTSPDTPVLINVLANDTDADGDSLSIYQISGGRFGAVTFSGGVVTYTPHPGVVAGEETVFYQATDGKDVSNPSGFTVTINQAAGTSIVAADTNGSGTVTRSGGPTAYPNGGNLNLTANPYPGYQFYHWDGAVRSTQNPLDIVIGEDTTLTAVFRPISNITSYASWAAIQPWSNSASQSPRTADPEADGRKNLAEFAFDLDPLNYEHRPDLIELATAGGEPSHFKVRYRRNLRAEGIIYKIEYSDDLVRWETHEGNEAITHYNPDGDFSAQEVEITVPAGEGQRYIRVEASVP